MRNDNRTNCRKLGMEVLEQRLALSGQTRNLAADFAADFVAVDFTIVESASVAGASVPEPSCLVMAIIFALVASVAKCRPNAR